MEGWFVRVYKELKNGWNKVCEENGKNGELKSWLVNDFEK